MQDLHLPQHDFHVCNFFCNLFRVVLPSGGLAQFLLQFGHFFKRHQRLCVRSPQRQRGAVDFLFIHLAFPFFTFPLPLCYTVFGSVPAPPKTVWKGVWILNGNQFFSVISRLPLVNIDQFGPGILFSDIFSSVNSGEWPKERIEWELERLEAAGRVEVFRLDGLITAARVLP